MKKKDPILHYACACLIMLCIVSCNNNDDDVRYMLPETRAINLTESQKEMVKSNNDFSFNLLRTAYSQQQEGTEKGKSLFLSPVGVTYMLGMVADGASGETLKEINDALGFSGTTATQVNELCQTLIEEAPKSDKNVKLEIANAIYINKGYTMTEQFKADMDTYYKADAQTLDFADVSSVNTINEWARKNTHGKIPVIINTLYQTEAARLFNSVYFEATWTKQFDRKMTRKDAFVMEDGTEKQLYFMNNKAIIIAHENEDCRMVCLPYGSGTLWNMYVIVPKGDQTVEGIVNKMDEEYWNSLWRTGKLSTMELKLPKFSTASNVLMSNVLQQMNVKRIFDKEDAQLDMICANKKPHISDIKQTGCIDVDEEGTKATAVTAEDLWESPGLMKGEPFQANRPFVYLIREGSSNAIFFAGVYQGD